jgi:phosphoglycolate phosphatase-like HAD superfamily hydrolase
VIATFRSGVTHIRKLEDQRFTACIFDFDGVIIDSEPLHARAKRLTLEQFQISYPPSLFSDFKGRTDHEAITTSFEAAELSACGVDWLAGSFDELALALGMRI